MSLDSDTLSWLRSNQSFTPQSSLLNLLYKRHNYESIKPSNFVWTGLHGKCGNRVCYSCPIWSSHCIVSYLMFGVCPILTVQCVLSLGHTWKNKSNKNKINKTITNRISFFKQVLNVRECHIAILYISQLLIQSIKNGFDILILTKDKLKLNDNSDSTCMSNSGLSFQWASTIKIQLRC
jgi:hypothetical protein